MYNDENFSTDYKNIFQVVFCDCRTQIYQLSSHLFVSSPNSEHCTPKISSLSKVT